MKGKKVNPAPRRGWVNRRRFLKEASYAAAGVIGFPYIVSASALGKAGRVAASERIVMGCIGVGGQGRGNMGGFMGKKQVRVVAVCDPNGKNRNQARDKANGVLFTGTEGKIEVNRGYLRTWPDSLKNQQIGLNEIHLYESRGHKDDFLECVRTRRQPICDVEIGCRSVTVCHLGNLAYQLKRPLKWDPENERFVNPALLKGGVNDEQANRMLWRPMRSPWHL